MTKLLTEVDPVTLEAPIKLAFFDVDGTLLCRDGQYSMGLKTQLARLRKSGVKTAIASGRPQFAAQFLFDELQICDMGVFCSGAYVFDPRHQQLHLQAPIARADALALIEHLRQGPIYYELYAGTHYYYECNTAAEIRLAHAAHLRSTPVRADLTQVAAAEPVYKFIVGVDSNEHSEALTALERAFPNLRFFYASLPAYPHWLFANVIDVEACKHRAFDWLLSHYRVASENVVSFGDSHSDEIFLQRAGVGVAMGNAPDRVKQVARFVTKDAWDDGVAYALERLVQ